MTSPPAPYESGDPAEPPPGEHAAALARDAATDLLLGGSCVGCGRPGRLLCRGCRAGLPRAATQRRPAPAPAGLAPSYSTGEYDGTLRAMILGAKERGQRGLIRPLGELLAAAVLTALAEGGWRLPVVLVPVPSRPASVRARGLDPILLTTRTAARVVRRAPGCPVVRVASLLRTRPGLQDQAGLDVPGRRANLAGALTCPSAGLARLARRCPRAIAVVCDDVLTSGSTAREAQRALEAVGLRVAAVATVAATPRRRTPPDGAPRDGVPGA